MDDDAEPDAASPFTPLFKRFAGGPLWKQIGVVALTVVGTLVLELVGLVLTHQVLHASTLTVSVFGISLSADFRNAEGSAENTHIETRGAGSPVLNRSNVGHDLNINLTPSGKR